MTFDAAKAFGCERFVSGVFTLSGGEVGFSDAEINEDGTFMLRYESGWNVKYRNDGVRPIAGFLHHKDGSVTEVPGGSKRNVVGFERLSFKEALDKYPGVAYGFHP